MQTELHTLINIIDKAAILEKTLEDLESRLLIANQKLLTRSTSNNWVVLSEAAKQLGLSAAALRQRIKRDQYPQGVVWRQKGIKSTIFINLVKLEEYL
jgi:hypothetical protein